MSSLWNTFFYEPIYNTLIFIVDKVTFGDIGFAIIILTIFIKFLLSPLTKKSIRSQVLMKRIEPELKALKKEFPNKEEQAKKTFELYKKYNVNPFSGCLVILLQLPVIFALYYVFYKGLSFDVTPLYSFISAPENINTHFLGLVDLHGKSIVFALLAGISQFIQGKLAAPLKPKKVEVVTEQAQEEPKTFQEQLADSMQLNVRYVLPVFVAFIAYQISAAIALYWIISNIFTIIQEWHVRRTLA
ncbi:MAG: YidC/Oxa1 family membrane protein insertase [Candidatus Paceibacterota bacterium]